MPSSHRLTSPSPLLASGGPPLDDDLVQQFDATHRLSELTTAWGTFVSSFGEKLQVSFSEVLSLDVRLSSVLMSYFSLSLFVQSFSQDHTDFFFSYETEKRLSSEISALKTELDLCRAEMETERQTHQREEQTLHARVVEAEERRDAAVQEALKNAEAMKKECNGIAGSFLFPFVFKFPFLLTCFLVPVPALWVKKQKLSEGIDEMKILVRSNHNKAEEVITRAEEELALAKLIRRGADRDLVQAQKLLKS